MWRRDIAVERRSLDKDKAGIYPVFRCAYLTFHHRNQYRIGWNGAILVEKDKEKDSRLTHARKIRFSVFILDIHVLGFGGM